VAVWWFFLRAPAPPVAEVQPEIVVVPSKPQAAAPQEFVKNLEPFVVPRHSGNRMHFLICKFAAVSTSPAIGAEMDHKMINLRDALYFYLSSKTDQFLLDGANVAEIKNDLMGVLNNYLSQGRIEDVLFESYLNE